MSERELFLEGKIKELEAEKATGASVQRLEIIDRELSFHKAELEQIEASKQQREEIIVNDPSTPFSLSSGKYTVDFRTEAASEESYQALRIVTQLKLQELEEQNQAEIKALKASYESDIAHNDQVIRQLKENVQQAEFEKSDFESRWKAATTEINVLTTDINTAAEQNELLIEEAATLKKTIEDLRNQLSKPTAPTNLDNDALAEAMEKLRASKPAIYNVVEINGTKSTAISVESNETIEFHPNYIGKYRIVSHDEAMQMRAVMEAEKDNIPDIAEPVEVEEPTIPLPEIPFREPEVSDTLPIDGVAGNPVETESVQNHDGRTVEERLIALELAVFGQVKAAA